jgi:hypothetical protein
MHPGHASPQSSREANPGCSHRHVHPGRLSSPPQQPGSVRPTSPVQG